MKNNKLFEALSDELAFILSYDDNINIIPKAIFKISEIKYVDNNRFAEVVLENINKKDDKVEKIYIPIKKFFQEVFSSCLWNNDLNLKIDDFENLNFKERELIALKILIQKYLNTIDPVSEKEFIFSEKNISLSKLEADYEKNGEIISNNFSLVPFNYRKLSF